MYYTEIINIEIIIKLLHIKIMNNNLDLYIC